MPGGERAASPACMGVCSRRRASRQANRLGAWGALALALASDKAAAVVGRIRITAPAHFGGRVEAHAAASMLCACCHMHASATLAAGGGHASDSGCGNRPSAGRRWWGMCAARTCESHTMPLHRRAGAHPNVFKRNSVFSAFSPLCLQKALSWQLTTSLLAEIMFWLQLPW